MRKPSPLLQEFLDQSIPLPGVDWETIPPGVTPAKAWESFEENVAGWVPVWFPTHEPCSGRSYGEFERAFLFEEGLKRILKYMHRWPLWGSAREKKRAVALALLQLCSEIVVAERSGMCCT